MLWFIQIQEAGSINGWLMSRKMKRCWVQKKAMATAKPVTNPSSAREVIPNLEAIAPSTRN